MKNRLWSRMGLEFTIGDRAPELIGARADGRFYSSDAQAGRPAILAPLGGLDPAVAVQVFETIRAAAAELDAAGVDVTPIAPPLPALIDAFSANIEACESVVFVTSAGAVATWSASGKPTAVLVDRSWRIVDVFDLTAPRDLTDCVARAAGRIATDAPQVRTSSAPVLVIPNVAAPAFCEALMAHFEASPHRPGTIAGFAAGAPVDKLDEAKKRRRDLELAAESPLYAEAVGLLANRCAPEIQRAFQVEVTNADRLLISRYDDDGGHFKRHRDNAAPHTAFREFAVSLNLNTGAYEGGELRFPEFDDDRYSPPAGAAIVFSAALLHEVSPVTAGRRYVMLSFLNSAAGQARLDRWLESQAQPAERQSRTA